MVDFPVPDAPESSVASGSSSMRVWPWNPPQFTSCIDSAIHWVSLVPVGSGSSAGWFTRGLLS